MRAERSPEPVPSATTARARPSKALVLASFAAVYVIWGSTYLALRIGVETIPPFLLGGCRFLLAGAALYGAARWSGEPPPSAAEWRQPAIAAVPLWVVLLEWARPGGERPTLAQLAAIGVGGLGLALLVTPSRSHATSPAGVLAVLASGLAWAIGTVYTRHVAVAGQTAARRPSSAIVSAQQMLAAGAGLLVVGAIAGEATPGLVARVSPRSLAAFAYLTLFGSLVAFSAFGYLVRVSTPAMVSTSAYVNPVVAVVLGWLVLDERLAPRTLAGATITVGAVALMTLGRRRAR
jgi:drug/metabolite transporter (DMT)-like permease